MVAIASDDQDLADNIEEILRDFNIDCIGMLESYWDLKRLSQDQLELLIYCCYSDPLASDFLWYLLRNNRQELKRLLLVHDVSKVENIDHLQLSLQIPFDPSELVSCTKALL